jgi:DNA primase
MPLIKRDFIESLSDKVDIISTIGKRITLTKKGKDYKACCPFHEEKTPSFSVSVDKGAYHCFGCGEGGYALSFVQKFDNLDFVDAVERLADENNIEVEYEEKSSPVDKTIPKLKELNQKVCDFFKQSLRTNPAKQKAVDYAKSRGITGEIAKVFDIGFAPPGNNLYNHFKKNDDDIKNLEKLGLIIKNDNGTYYERFSDRLIFPILNPRNQVVGFGGRALKSSDKAKYLNSSQSPIFDKSSELYGLTYARKFTKKIEYLLVVEGYMDVVGLHSSGITSCVATLGTATTESHIKTLSRNSHLIIFCF